MKGPEHIAAMYGSGAVDLRKVRMRFPKYDYSEVEKRWLVFASRIWFEIGYDPRNHFGKYATRTLL